MEDGGGVATEPIDGEGVLAAVQDAVVVLDGEGRVRYANPTAEHIAGRTLPPGTEVAPLLHADDAADVAARVRERRIHPQRTLTMRLRRPDGTDRWVEAVGVDRLDDPAVNGFVITVRDVDERIRTRRALTASEATLRAMLEASPDAVARLTPDMRIVYANSAAEALMGVAPDAALGHTPEELGLTSDLTRRWRRDVADVLEDRKAKVQELEVPTPQGDRWVEVRTVPEIDEHGHVSHVVAVMRDVHEQRKRRLALEAASLEDPLTALANRRHFLAALQRALNRRLRSGRPLAVLYLDLDDFKPVNDAFGHATGDEVLVKITERIRHSLRPGDLAGRVGGDEFTILLDEVAGPGDALAVAERIRAAIDTPVLIDHQEIAVSVSIGVALAAGTERDAEAMVGRADDALYEAKRRGRDCVVLFTDDMYERTGRRTELAGHLRRAAEHDEFVLHYQPELDLASGRIWSVEALLRWRAVGGLHPAAEFVEVAEQIGLLDELLPQLVEESTARLAGWRAGHPDLSLRLRANLSPRQLLDADLEAVLAGALSRHGLPPNAICLEVWAEAIGPTSEPAVAAITALKRLGVATGVDGFGRSAIRLDHLGTEVDVLSLDRGIVAGVGRGGLEEAIVRGVVAVAHDLGIRVVASGVERPEQLARARAIGIDGAQGTLIAPPLPPEEIEDLLRAGDRIAAG